MTLSDLSIQRPVFTWMLALGLLVFGVLGYSRLGVDRYPDMSFPEVTITARLEGASPAGMEEDVTDVLEERVSTISGIRELSSSSHNGVSRVQIQFELGTDIDVAVQDVRDQVSRALDNLPRNLEPVEVAKMQVNGFPIVYVPFMSERPRSEITEFVERRVKPMLETLPGVGSVYLYGELERNVRIWLDPDALRARELAANDVMQALRRQHVDRPGGFVEGSNVEWSVKTDAEFRSIAELGEMVVARRGDATIRLSDVARLEDGEEDARSIAFFNNRPAVVAAVAKVPEANTVDVVDRVRERVAEIEKILPHGIDTVPPEQFVDFSLDIRESVAETQFALLFGAGLAVFVVFVFLRRMRPTMIVAAAIPLSLIATFGLVYVWGYTLNMMTLLGLTLAIGVVIDDAIIVLENIERHREMGKGAKQAASDGTRQITFAAIAATISVAAVFLPVAFAEGVVGNFLGEFGLTVAGSVIVSLFVALTLTPMLAARMPPPKERPKDSVYWKLERGFDRVESSYRRVLDLSLRHRTLTFAFAMGTLLLAGVFGSRLDGEFFPSADGGVVYTVFELPSGTSLETTTKRMFENAKYLWDLPESNALLASIGTTSSSGVGRPSRGNIFMTLKPAEERERGSQEIMRAVRRDLGRYPGQKLLVMDPSGSFTAGGEFQMLLQGNVPLDELDAQAQRLVQALKAKGGYVDLNTNLDIGMPEIRVIPDRDKAAALDVDAVSVAEVVQVMVGGADVGIFKEDGKRYDIRMRLERDDRETPEAIGELTVRSRSGEVVELRNLVRVETGAAASAIPRTDRQRSVTISGSLEGIAIADATQQAMEIAAEVLPAGLELRPAGQADVMLESFQQFFLMLLLAILAIYMILAMQFESFVHPLAVMMALPFSLVGALGGLWLAGTAFGMGGMSLNVFSMIGIILLFGLVTKNSILLVDYANQLRSEGVDKVAAIREAAPVRMRPVLMTGLSMIFGVLPSALGLGPGAAERAPMAIATAAGMFSSMMLTLLFVPLFYLWLDDAASWLRGATLGHREVTPEESAEGAPVRLG